MALGIKPIVDFAFKKIFGSPENVIALIGLLNAILDLDDTIEEVEILNPFSYQDFANDKLVVLDVRATDTAGRNLNIEMQISPHGGLLERLTYYACGMYVDQLGSGELYAKLRPALSICLLSKDLFGETDQAHHRFQLVDIPSGRELSRGIEVHTVELAKYNLDESTIRNASPIEQWAFFLLFADRYDAEQLRELLPAVEFQQAISVIETIAHKTEDKVMYDQRAKAQLDYEWVISSAKEEGREEGREEGEEKGIEKGLIAGKIQLLQQLLGDEELSTAALTARPLSELASLQTELQERLRNRDA